mgnify:CR=1 FL=1|tara:strand:+ start:1372 stop:1560 length:189 start_codon:yes stop_codon:yes gene_type:complete
MSLTKRMIELQREAVENAIGGTQDGFEPCLSMSLDMMLDCEIIPYDDDIQRLLACYLMGVLA